MINYFYLLVLLLAVLSPPLPSGDSLYGQQYHSNNISERLFEFTDKKSIPITVGHLENINRDSLTVIDGNGNSIEIPIRKLSKQSQEVVNNCRALDQAASRKVEEAKKYFLKLDTRSTTIKQRYLQKISELGSQASPLSEEIIKISAANEDEFGIAAFWTFMSICDGDEKTFELMVSALKTNQTIRLRIQSQPERFLTQLGKFQRKAEEILIYSAYNCTLKLDGFDASQMSNPRALLTTEGPENITRAAAAYSLAFMDSTRGMDAMFKTLKAAETKINGEHDTTTIKGCYTGCAEKGWQVTAANRYMDFYKKYRNKFQVEGDYWFKNQTEMIRTHFKTEQLRRSSKMRNFYDHRGYFLTRATVEKTEDGMVLISDSKDKKHTVPLGKFSKEDISWLNSKFRLK